MNKFNLKSLSASQLRLILFAATVIIVVAQVGLIFIGQRIVLSSSQPVADAVARSSSSQQTLQDLEIVRVALDKQKDTVEKSSRVVADKSNTYVYQNQIIRDISAYAAMVELNAVSFTFDSSEGSDPAALPAPTAAPSATAEPSAGAGATAAPASSTATVNVAFDGSLTYQSFFRFLRLLEGNLLRMEIDGINLSRSSGGGEGEDRAPDALDISSLSIKVHTR